MIGIDQVLRDVQQAIPSWKELVAQNIQAKRLSGITNGVFLVRHNKSNQVQPQAVIYRVFGSDQESTQLILIHPIITDQFLNRAIENKILQRVAEAGIGPKIYGFNQKIRLEEYIPSEGVDSKSMLQDSLIEMVAFTLQRFHSLDVDFMPKESVFVQMCNNPQHYLQRALTKMGKTDLFTEAELKIIEELRPWLNETELKWIQSTLPQLDQKTVFSHNDLLAGNMLLRKDNGQIELIDYEYAGYNYKAYDIANYFAESMIDYFEQQPCYKFAGGLPPKDKVRYFVECYVAAAKFKGSTEFVGIAKDRSALTQFIEQKKLIPEVDRIVDQILHCTMLCHFYWGSWSITVSKNPHTSFDYVSFAKDRMRQYYYFKQQCFPNHK